MTDARPDPPALTDAEGAFVDHYLAVVDRVGSMNPANGTTTIHSYLHAAQALVSESRLLLKAIELMAERGEKEIFASTLTRSLLDLDGARRSRRVCVPPAEPTGGDR
jgi:hypothetical protein